MIKTIFRLCAVALLAGQVLAQAALAPPSVQSFFSDINFSEPKLSPSGKYLAVRVALPGERDRLSVVDLADFNVKVVAMFSDADVGYFQWVNDERLVFDTADKRVTYSDDNYGPGLYAVNRDGAALKKLVQTSGGMVGTVGDVDTGSHMRVQTLLKWDHFLLRQTGRQDSDSVYVYSPTRDQSDTIKHYTLKKLNTLTGRTSPVNGPERAFGWLLDQRGEPRIAVVQVGSTNEIYYRDGDDDGVAWRKLTSFQAFAATDYIDPVGFGPDGSLYVKAGASDKSALYKFDLMTGKVGKTPVLELDGYDFDGRLILGQDKLLGVSYETDVNGVAWFDPSMKVMQATIDAKLPGRVNLIKVPKRGDSPWVLVTSYSDVEPTSFIAFNAQTGKLLKLGSSHPDINPAQMGRQILVHYPARDGLDIPAWITYPQGASRKNLPMVVLVHGGPYVRGNSWGWNAQAQFLASRGYAVLEPEFRGSTGFGEKHFRSGWKQWGLAMQDDIADGAKWAIAAGIVDPKRVCIAGASYGGYATLMGLIKDPDLFKCGIDWAGVTDIKLLYTGHWSFDSDLDQRWKNYGMPNLVGDLVKDAAQLEATSPLVQAARLKQPLLLAYGTEDYRVPIFHGQKFYNAVKASNPNVEWVSYDKEGHGWRLPKNRYDFWTRVEQFLERNIGAH